MKAPIDSTIPDTQKEAHEMIRRQIDQWFDWMDRILDIHRSNFVFREANPKELEQHKAGLKSSLRACYLINALVADPDFNQSDLVSRLRTRIQQLEDAYSTFHDPELSDEKAERIVQQVFPRWTGNLRSLSSLMKRFLHRETKRRSTFWGSSKLNLMTC